MLVLEENSQPRTRGGKCARMHPSVCGAARVAWLGVGRAVFDQPGPRCSLFCGVLCCAELCRLLSYRQPPTGTASRWINLLQLLGMRWAGGCGFVPDERTCYADQGCFMRPPLLSSGVLSVVWRMLLL